MNATPLSFPQKANFSGTPKWLTMSAHLSSSWSPEAHSQCQLHRVTHPKQGELGLLASSSPETWSGTSRILGLLAAALGQQPLHLRLASGLTTGWLASAKPPFLEVMLSSTSPVLVMSPCQTLAQHLQMALTHDESTRGWKPASSHPEQREQWDQVSGPAIYRGSHSI